MKTKKGFLMLVLSLILVASLLFPTMALSASPDNLKKPDKEKPVPAKNVQIIKKVTMKPGPPKPPPGKDKPKKQEGAATGIPGAPVIGERYAIVVGISDYPGISNDLRYADDDAQDIATALTDVYGFTNVTLLTDGGATRSAILSAISNIPEGAGEVVFSFSGHGAQGEAEDGDNEIIDEAIVAHDGFDLVPIWDGELKAAFSGLSPRIVFIFDICLAGGMTDLEGSGRVINMAASETGLSYEYGTLQNGQFTYYFVDEGIMQGFADSYDHDNDTIVAKKKNPGEPDDVFIEEAFDYAKKKCRRQKPTISDSFEDDLMP
ncbi:caspase domain-containing protein [Chloroflexota bacterium]